MTVTIGIFMGQTSSRDRKRSGSGKAPKNTFGISQSDVAAVVDFTGYNRHTVCEWIRFGKLHTMALQQKYMIPKCYLIDWISTDEHNTTTRKSRRHIDRLWELQKWSDGQ